MNTQQQQRTKISFSPNTPPQTLEIEWTPEARPGRYGQQFMYKFKGELIWFADEEVHFLIEEALGRPPEAGDTITVAKTTARNPDTNRQGIQWIITAGGNTAAAQHEQPRQWPVNSRPRQQQQQQQQQQPQQQPKQTTPIATQQDDSPKRDPTSQLAAALFCAYDALSMLNSYSSEHGYPLNFNTGDVRALASTMIIQRQETAAAAAAKGRAA